MAVRIRLRRTGKRNAPAHRIVVTDQRSPRNGRFIECIGTYDPRHSTEDVDIERADYWISRGAQPSETVSAIIKRGRASISLADQKGTEAGKTFIHESQKQKPKSRKVEPAEAEEEETADNTQAVETETPPDAETKEAEAATEATAAEDESAPQDKTEE